MTQIDINTKILIDKRRNIITNKSDKYETRKIIGLFLGLVLLLIILLLPVPQGLKPSGMAMATVAALMITWWVCYPRTMKIYFLCKVV